MYISKMRIKNYKSFLDSGEILLDKKNLHLSDKIILENRPY